MCVEPLARRRRCTWVACILVVALFSTSGRAQPVFSVQDLDRAMKAIGRFMGLAQSAIGTGDFEAAKTRVARAREQLFPTVAFWRNNKEAAAEKLLREAVTALDELDVALSTQPADAAAARAAAAKVDAACQRCHAQYREEDAASKTFSVKQRK
jgi:cytochrome c556